MTLTLEEVDAAIDAAESWPPGIDTEVWAIVDGVEENDADYAVASALDNPENVKP